MFAERSFASVTIKDIAGKLRINPALIYYYFESKQDLFRASIEAAIFDAVAHYEGIRSSHDHPVGLINAWLESNIKLSHTISNLVKVMLDHSGLPRKLPSVDRLVKQFYEEEYRILSGAIGRGIELGVFQPVDQRRMALFVSSHLDGVMVAAKIRPNFDLAQAIEDLRDSSVRQARLRPWSVGNAVRRRERTHPQTPMLPLDPEAQDGNSAPGARRRDALDVPSFEPLTCAHRTAIGATVDPEPP